MSAFVDLVKPSRTFSDSTATTTINNSESVNCEDCVVIGVLLLEPYISYISNTWIHFRSKLKS